ncbi:MAG: hypothetical protein HXS46_00720 [Theionarchaea archaeon]|nr:hypothetical protein [Theionarchaea archaeon]
MFTQAIESKQKSTPERQELKMEVVGEFVKKHQCWEYSKQGKNYIAEVTGLSKRYGFKRRFLDLIYRGREKHFLLKDFVPGHLYEIVSIQYKGRKEVCTHIKNIFECVSIGEDGVLFREIFDNEVLERFSEHDDMIIPKILVQQLLRKVSVDEAIALIEESSKSNTS